MTDQYTLLFRAHLEDGQVVMEDISTEGRRGATIPFKEILWAIGHWAITMAEQEPDGVKAEE